MEEKIKLHLGCGDKNIEGFINVDVRNLPTVDVVDDITILTSFKEESVDLIYASHVLEHIGRRDYLNVLKRWYSLLKKDGVLRISVPDFEEIVNHYSENKDLLILRGFLYGGQTYPENYHYCTWDFKTLENDLLTIGFKNIRRYDWGETEHSNIDDFSQAYLPHMDKKNGRLMSLNVEVIK
jgi:predicted SAM-dependent methyltransferase